MKFIEFFFYIEPRLRLVFEVFYADNCLHFFHFLQVADNGIHVFHIVYIELDVAFEQAVHGFNEYLTNVDIKLFGHDVAYLVQDAQCIDTLDV